MKQFPSLHCFAVQLDICADGQFSCLIFVLLIDVSACIHFMIALRWMDEVMDDSRTTRDDCCCSKCVGMLGIGYCHLQCSEQLKPSERVKFATVATLRTSEMLRVTWSDLALAALFTRALSTSSLLVMLGVRPHNVVMIIFWKGECKNISQRQG